MLSPLELIGNESIAQGGRKGICGLSQSLLLGTRHKLEFGAAGSTIISEKLTMHRPGLASCAGHLKTLDQNPRRLQSGLCQRNKNQFSVHTEIPRELKETVPSSPCCFPENLRETRPLTLPQDTACHLRGRRVSSRSDRTAGRKR